MVWIVIVLVVALVALLVYVLSSKGRRSAEPPARAKSAMSSPPSRGQSAPTQRYIGKRLIVPDPTVACVAVRELDGQCFALSQLPELPVKGRTSKNCQCRFDPLVERRSGKERRSGQERRDQIRFEETKDRRSGFDRRSGKSFQWHGSK
jgi:hypothetical protein